jgi:hypothetical protein
VRAEHRKDVADREAAAKAKAEAAARPKANPLDRTLVAKEVPATQPRIIRVAMNARVGQMRLIGRPLADVISELRANTGQNIFVNWKALEAIRVKRDLPVTTDLSSLTLSEALDKLMREIGGSQERLGYQVDDDVVTVSTLRDLGKNSLTRVYDLHELLKNRATREADLAALVKRFQGIDPLSWRDAGGEVGAIRELQEQLIITQTPEVHMRIIHEIEELLPDEERQQFPPLNSRAEPARK